MRRCFVLILAAASLIVPGQPASAQPAAITRQCLNALRARALAADRVTPVNPEIMRRLGIRRNAAYPTRRTGFADGDGTRIALAVGPENPPRMLLARETAQPGAGFATSRIWLMDRGGNLIAAVFVAYGQARVLNVRAPAVRAAFAVEWSRLAAWARTQGVCT